MVCPRTLAPRGTLALIFIHGIFSPSLGKAQGAPRPPQLAARLTCSTQAPDAYYTRITVFPRVISAPPVPFRDPVAPFPGHARVEYGQVLREDFFGNTGAGSWSDGWLTTSHLGFNLQFDQGNGVLFGTSMSRRPPTPVPMPTPMPGPMPPPMPEPVPMPTVTPSPSDPAPGSSNEAHPHPVPPTDGPSVPPSHPQTWATGYYVQGAQGRIVPMTCLINLLPIGR